MFIAKMQGTIVDLLVAPLSSIDLLAAFPLAAVVRGLPSAASSGWSPALFTGFSVAHPAWVLAFALLVATAFALIGLAVAIWSDKFEQLNLVPTFVITPLTFLGGVFYSRAHAAAAVVDDHAAAIPILYMVEGLRYGMLGRSDVSPWLGLAMTVALLAGSGAVVWVMLARGYKLRA